MKVKVPIWYCSQVKIIIIWIPLSLSNLIMNRLWTSHISIYCLCYMGIVFCTLGNKHNPFACCWAVFVISEHPGSPSILREPGVSKAVGCSVSIAHIKYYSSTLESVPPIGLTLMVAGKLFSSAFPKHHGRVGLPRSIWFLLSCSWPSGIRNHNCVSRLTTIWDIPVTVDNSALLVLYK